MHGSKRQHDPNIYAAVAIKRTTNQSEVIFPTTRHYRVQAATIVSFARTTVRSMVVDAVAASPGRNGVLHPRCFPRRAAFTVLEGRHRPHFKPTAQAKQM